MFSGLFFPYSWHIDEEETEVTCMRIYGLNDKNQNICLRINNFTPYVYIELPIEKSWNNSNTQLVVNKINELLGKQRPLENTLVWKYKLYGAYLDDSGNRKKFPYLFCNFSNRGDIKSLTYKLKNNQHIVGMGSLKFKVHESDADPVLQFTCCRKIPTAGWVKFHGNEVHSSEKLTLCDHEYMVKWKHVTPYQRDGVAKPKIMGFDIEVNSTNPSAMPKADKIGDKIFQISCVLARDGDNPNDYEKYLLTLGQPDPDIVGEDVLVQMFETEASLLEGFTTFIREENPNIIVGYNILGFDIPYMIARAKMNMCIFDFDKQGFHKFAHAKERIIKWSSSAYKNQEFEFLDAEGRVYVDLLPLVKRDFKFNNYKLKTISEYFIGETKDPLTPKGIFKCYRIGIKKDKNNQYSNKAQRAMGIVGKYCVQDSALVVRLMDKLKTWVGLTEMASVCNVPIFSLYTQGQQIKVFSQLYKHCMYEDIVVEKDGYQVSENERYVGAKVFPPIPGRYKMVVPFDFASLYPTTIIAYNIDYHTWVPPGSNISDSMCHVMEWEDHLGCEHDPKVIRKLQLTKYIDTEKEEIKKLREKRNALKDALRKKELMDEINSKNDELKPYIEERSELTKTIAKNPMCACRKYRFLKEPRGVLPNIIQNCLDARKHTRKVDMKKCKEEIARLINDTKENGTDNTALITAQNTLLDVLDKRQLAFKVSANSMYGAMGVRRGYLPFMPGAMCTTYMGRTNIEVVAKTIPEKYGGELIYGDTDTILATTPVLILENNVKYYTTLENLSAGDWKKTVTGKEISSPKHGIKVWSDQGFTEIKYVMRHAIEKPMIKVTTHTATIVCTLDHSLLWENGEPALGSEIKLKDKLCHRNLPLPDDTPEEPVYPNNLTAEKIREYIISNDVYEYLSAELAFVWGVFFADGSCGSYQSIRSGLSNTWAINKKDNLLLERCLNILLKYETELDFKILDTMKSSHVNKLVAKQKSMKKEHKDTIKEFVERYRELFYDNRKYKKVPDIVLNAPYSIREAFFMGYYAGDGSKKDPALTITNKGEIGCAGLFFLLRSIGYQVSINTRGDKPDTYKLTGSTPMQKFRYHPNAVKKIEPYQTDDEYIYDIETSNHHFAAGVGQMVVHNSNYIHFPHLTGAQETWDYALYVASEVTKLFPKPIELEFEEEIYAFFFILSKKRYMYRKCLRDGVVDKKIGKKGVLLARRDNSKFIRDTYECVISKIADDVSRDDILYYVINQINELCSGIKPISDFVVTKSIGDSGGLLPEAFVNEKGVKKAKVGDYTVPILSNDKKEREEQIAKKGADSVDDYYLLCLPAQVQLAERMRMRGQRVDPGTRLEYVVCDPNNHTGKQYEKIESADYLAKHKQYIDIDYMYYLKALINPLDQVLDVAYGNETDYKKGFIDIQYKQRWKIRHKLMEELKNLFTPNLIFKE
jgi:DNA polymerase elongation subunit (family B)